MKRVVQALPWLIACLHASSWADPMRPLIPPAATPPESATAPSDRSPRPAKARDPDAPREPERLVAIRQDSASRWQALFGERWVSAGDRLENYTVAAIEANTVQLADGRQRRVLHLLPPLWRPGPGASSPGVAAGPPTSTRISDFAQAHAAAPPNNRAFGLPLP